MAFTVPQFAIPFTVAGTVTITFTDASTTAATVVSATRYNDRRFSSSTDAAAYVATAMSSADSGGDCKPHHLLSRAHGQDVWV